ncbi:Kinase, NEK [Giardia lamblia P15]|uniref:non-specific serine/threonine protein kinase n=1 Tax=Giardia intestinalis (strain P15) TaxID=658858 RepID=E1EZC2_GIAIA|nr:Kinase, NEK [Giardia lamblia P15]
MIRILDRFCVGKPFKTCSYSIIYEAADLRIQKSCLCKVYEYGTLPPHEAAVLHREVALIKRLRHPLLVHYLSVLHDHAGQRYFLFMEQIKQETLGQYIRRRKALDRVSHLPERNIWYILSQFTDLLSYLHDCGPNHEQALLYSLTPESIFIDNLDIITVSFLSLSRKLVYHKCFSVHTAEYRAPELLRTGVATTKSDIWSLGCILYELCTFRPFCLVINSMDAVQKLGKLQRKVQIPRYSTSLTSIINILLELEPECRLAVDVLSVNGIIRELIQSYKARLGNYGLKEREHEGEELTPHDAHLCSIHADDDSSINLLCTQASIESCESSELATVSNGFSANVKAHYVARYNDILLLDFEEKRGCSILDDTLLANKQQSHVLKHKRQRKHNSSHSRPIVQGFTQDKDQHKSQLCTSSYNHDLQTTHQPNIMVGLDYDQDNNVKTMEQGGNSAQVSPSLRRNWLDSAVFSVKTPYMSQFTDDAIQNE